MREGKREKDFLFLEEAWDNSFAEQTKKNDSDNHEHICNLNFSFFFQINFCQF
jgi:hypothetical protein